MKKVYHIKHTQFINSNIETVWEFFSLPSNLDKITPPAMKFNTLHITGGERMYSGQLICYKVSPLPLFRIRWTTEIKNVSYQKYFIDEQKHGPFSLWYHQHIFIEKPNGVEMVDEVSYALPLGWIGRVVNLLFMETKVKGIFEYRRKAIDQIFNGVV